ncbi:lipid A-modifier LpxR family protein [Hymenobacter sp. B81]|uniref:lipid A-modifier LpxR family protein n=1 Tax=Hymenobacter sp. B81 TaxID=3344878 RepID=UPI0037DDD408
MALAAASGAQGQGGTADSTVSADRLISYTFANDAGFRTDYYYTQGMTLQAVHPAMHRLPTSRILLNSKPGATQYYGVKLHYDGFTPLRIQDAFIRVGDRPYASYIYAALFRVANHPARRQRLSSALHLGYLGPGAGAKGFQTTLHRWLDSPTPRGWNYQVQHDLVLGYEVRYERQLLAAGRNAELLGATQASLGTLYTHAGVGATLRAGRLNPYFQNLGTTARPHRAGLRRLQLYAQAQGEARAVGYNATLQGGLLNRDNPYTLSTSEVRRVVLRGTVSVVIAYEGTSLEVAAVHLTPEFSGGRSHRWLRLGLQTAF